MVVRQGGVLIVAGLVAGLVLAVFAGQLVKSFLYNVKPIDIGTYVGVAFVLLVVDFIALNTAGGRAYTSQWIADDDSRGKRNTISQKKKEGDQSRGGN